MRKTAYFSLALMLAAVVFVARFGVRPETPRPNQTGMAAIASAAGARTPLALVAATPTVAATRAPASPITRTPIPSPTTTPTTGRESEGESVTPNVLSGSGADRPAEQAKAAEPKVENSRTLRLVAPTATPAATDPPPTPTRRPTARPPSATTSPAAASRETAPAQPERIVAPTIGLDSKIIPVGWHQETNPDGSKRSEWDVASFAVSWHKTSAKLGEPGNTVLTGHNNIEGEVFRHLEHFNIGDPITIYSGQRAFKYAVTDKFILRDKDVPYEQRLENAKWIGLFPDERITLVSCWPPTDNTHRIFIIAKPVVGS